MLVFIKAVQIFFSALNDVHQFLSQWRSSLVLLKMAVPHN